jgi:hypothetical protein
MTPIFTPFPSRRSGLSTSPSSSGSLPEQTETKKMQAITSPLGAPTHFITHALWSAATMIENTLTYGIIRKNPLSPSLSLIAGSRRQYSIGNFTLVDRDSLLGNSDDTNIRRTLSTEKLRKIRDSAARDLPAIWPITGPDSGRESAVALHQSPDPAALHRSSPPKRNPGPSPRLPPTPPNMTTYPRPQKWPSHPASAWDLCPNNLPPPVRTRATAHDPIANQTPKTKKSRSRYDSLSSRVPDVFDCLQILHPLS